MTSLPKASIQPKSQENDADSSWKSGQLAHHVAPAPSRDLQTAVRTDTGTAEAACEELPFAAPSARGLSESCKEELRWLKSAPSLAPVAFLAECLPTGISAEHALARAGIEFQLQDKKVRERAMSLGRQLLAVSGSAVAGGLLMPGELADQHWLERIARERFRIDPVQGIVPALAEHLELLTRKLIVWRDFNKRSERSNSPAAAKLPFRDRWYGKMAREALMRLSPGHLDMSAQDLPYVSTMPPSVADCEQHQKNGASFSLEEQAAINHTFRLERLSERALRRLMGSEKSEKCDRIASKWFQAKWGLECPDEPPQDRRARLRSLLAKYGVDYPTICLDSATTAPMPEGALAGFPSTAEAEQEGFKLESEDFTFSASGAAKVEESGFFVPQPEDQWVMKAQPTLYAEERKAPQVQVYVPTIEADSAGIQEVFDVLTDLSKYFKLFSGFAEIRDLGKPAASPEVDVQSAAAHAAQEEAPPPGATDVNSEPQQVGLGAEFAPVKTEAEVSSEPEALTEPARVETDSSDASDAAEAVLEGRIAAAAEEESNETVSLRAEGELAEEGKKDPPTKADEGKGGSIQGMLSRGRNLHNAVGRSKIEVPWGIEASGGKLLVGAEELSVKLTGDGTMTMVWRPRVRKGDIPKHSSFPVVEVILDGQGKLNAYADTVRRALEAAAETGASGQLSDLSTNPFFEALSKAGKIRRLENAVFGKLGNRAFGVVSLDLAEDAVLEQVNFFGAGTLVRLHGGTAAFNRVNFCRSMLDMEVSSGQWRDCFATDTTVIRGALGASHFDAKCRMLWDASRADCRLVSVDPSLQPGAMKGQIVDLARFPARLARKLGVETLSSSDLERMQADQSAMLGKERLLELVEKLAASMGIPFFNQGNIFQAKGPTRGEVPGEEMECLVLSLNEMHLPGARQWQKPGEASEARERTKALLVIVVKSPESREPCAIKLCWQDGRVLRQMAQLTQPGLNYQDAVFKLLDIFSTGNVALPLGVTPQARHLVGAKQRESRRPDSRLARLT